MPQQQFLLLCMQHLRLCNFGTSLAGSFTYIIQGAQAQVCNLHQNPQHRCIVSALLPTLLRNGCMWLLLDPELSKEKEERWLLSDDTCIGERHVDTVVNTSKD